MIMNDARKDEARRLRLETRMSLAQLRDHFGVSRETLTDWLDGLPNPEWTLRPQAKDELRAEAVELRKNGCSVPDIARRLGVAKSTAFLWTRHLPLDPTPEHAEARVRRHMEHMREVRWEPYRRERDANRAAINEAQPIDRQALRWRPLPRMSRRRRAQVSRPLLEDRGHHAWGDPGGRLVGGR
jgi:DNA-binding XRE family transcriptional regulator